MKIGDKVRFLNAVGGGIVRRFQGKDVVYVEEEDGFETPVLIRECVIVDDREMQVKSTSKPVTPVPEVKAEEPEKKEYEVVEVAGGDKLNVFLAYLPIDIKNLGKCNYETFFINDSNYYLFFNYMSCKNSNWNSRFSGIVEPNTRLFVEEFAKEQINDLEKVCIQFVAYKKDKPFSLKNAYSVELRIDGVKFYKLHSFRENDFFEDDALIYPVVMNDIPEREMLVSASDLQEAMNQKVRVDRTNRLPAPAKKKTESPVLEVDLHVNELLDTTAGLDNTAILNIQLEKFNEVMDRYKDKKGQKIVFIHGKGEGVLRNAILAELKQKYKNMPYQDASFKEYGFGATMVTIK